jgi:alpha-glucosidase
MLDSVKILLSAFLLSALAASAQLPAAAHTPSGVEVSNSQLSLRVDALRDDVLRVRVFPIGHPAEDASWAVLPAARTARVAVVAEENGFRTAALRVTVGNDLRVTVADLSGNVLESDALPVAWSADGFQVTKVKSSEDHYFGLGDKPGPLDRAGEAFVMWNTDSFGWQESTDPIYKSIPFFIQMREGRGLGVLFDNTFRTFFDFGRERNDRMSFSAPAGPLDYYLLFGPEPKKVLGEYAWLTGPTPLPPLWTLGFQQSRYSYFPETQVREIAERLRADRIPSDAIYLDIDYQYKNRPFTVDNANYPDFPGLIHDLSAEHLHTVLITDLHIADLPNAGYMPYDTGEAGDHFVKQNGKDYVGPVWPGPSVFPDFTRAATRAWWGTLYTDFVKDGASGFWNDMNEPAVFRYPSKTFPDDVVHRIDEPGFVKRTAMHPEIHNIYGMENSRATWEGLLTLKPNERPFVLTRASYAGGQRYAATWTGDNLATWNHLRQTTPQLENLGLSGFSLSGADVGGFGGSPSPELLTRWLMLAAFQPIDRDHAAKGTRPHEVWVDGPEQEAVRRRYIEERYKLMPYLYTTAEETSRDGVPILRPLFVEAPLATCKAGTTRPQPKSGVAQSGEPESDNCHPLDLDAAGEFFFGPSILVAASPLPDDIAPYEVHLPPGVWYDYWTGAMLDRRAPLGSHDNEIRDPTSTATPALAPLMVSPKLADLPVYVRAGAIVPMQPLVQSTDETPNGPLTLRVFPPLAGDPCSGDVYTDDGHTYDFRHGAYLRLHITCSVATDGALTVTIPAGKGSYKPWWSALRIEAVGFAPKEFMAMSGGQSRKLEQSTLGWAATFAGISKIEVTLR